MRESTPDLIMDMGALNEFRFKNIIKFQHYLEENVTECFALIGENTDISAEVKLQSASLVAVIVILLMLMAFILVIGWIFRKRIMVLFNINFDQPHSNHILVETNPKLVNNINNNGGSSNNQIELKDHTLKLEEEVSDMPNMGLENFNFELNLDNIGNHTLNTAKEEDANSNMNDSFPSHSPKNNNFHIEFSRVEDVSKILNTDQCFDPDKDE